MAQFGSGKNPPWARAAEAAGQFPTTIGTYPFYRFISVIHTILAHNIDSPLTAQQNSLAAAALQNIAAAAAGQQVGVPQGPMLTQPAVATPTVYSLATTNPSLAPHQYTGPQINMVAQVPQVSSHIFWM